MGRFYFAIIVVVLIALFIIFSFIISAYKKCPPGHVLIINNNKPDAFGNLNKIVFSGGAFVWPIVGSYQLYSLAPSTIDLNIADLVTKSKEKLQKDISAIIGISASETVLKNAIDRFSGLSKDQISKIAKNIIQGQIRLIVSDSEITEIENSNYFSNRLKKEIEGELLAMGLKLISLDVKKTKKA